MRFDVIVIGAGAAGMMCAAEASTRGRRVLLIEHAAKIGERIRISGGGRCNFSNRTVGASNFLSRNPHFCRSALARFSTRDFVAMVESRGILYEEREHGQLFCKGSAIEIIDLLKAACDGVQWAHPCSVHSIERIASGDARISVGDARISVGDARISVGDARISVGDARIAAGDARFAVSTDKGRFLCTSLVIATGGLAVPQLGASPFGYKVAEQFGLAIVPPRPALVPLALAPEVLGSLEPLSGISIPAVTRCAPGQPEFAESLLITHRGLSGPAILQISNYWQFQEGPKHPVSIDLLPGIDAAAWLASHRHGKLLLANLLAEKLPRRFAHEWCALEGLERPLNEMSNRDLAAAAAALQGWTMAPAGTLGFAKAEVTLGGVDTDGLSSKTMEAAAVHGLYFVGEVVDVTGWLGGYNFQWAWSSGWVAGQYA